VEELGGRLGSWENRREDQKLGKDEGNLEGIVWSGKPNMDHKKSIIGS